MRHALECLGRPCPPDEVLASFIGPPLRQSFATILATSDAEQIASAVALYRERLSAKGLYENEVYAGIPQMLERVGQVASASFVVTSKVTMFARRIVEHFGLDRHFSRVYGSQLDGRFDDKTELIAHVLEVQKIDPAAAVMIGDRAVDIRGARANSIRAIGVLWGYGSQRELVEAGADRLCATPGELVTAL
jgi:phosphoglycolate phosphatase